MNKSTVNSPDSVEVPVMTRLLEVAHRLEARVEAALGAVGLSLAKFGVLKALAEAGDSLPLSQLAQRIQCVRSNITQLVDRLEADGLVRRLDDPDDRRVVRAALTQAGRESFDEGVRIVADQEQAVADALSQGDAAALHGALGRL